MIKVFKLGSLVLIAFLLAACGQNVILDNKSLSRQYRFTIELSTSVATQSDPFVRVHVNDYRLSQDNKKLTLLDGALIYVVRFDNNVFAHKFTSWDINVSPQTEIIVKTTDGSSWRKFYRGPD